MMLFSNIFFCVHWERYVVSYFMTKSKLIFICFLVLEISCKQLDKGHNGLVNKFPLTKDYLTKSEWMIDSIYGSKSFIQDWIYFTPDNKFWRCSYYNSSYIIDSSIKFKNDIVLSAGQKKYQVYTIDSSNILLVDSSSTVFHCRRWNSFSPEKIERFVKGNPKKKLLNGYWLLDTSEISPTRVPSFCDSLYAGTKFYFNPDGTFDIYAKDSTAKCGAYSYKIWENEISFIEYDMVMGFDIIRLTSDSLVIKSTFVPRDAWDENATNARENGYELYFTKLK